MAKCSSDNQMERSPWMCHICDYKSAETESQACDLCFRVTCPLHLRPASVYNEDNGLYETARVCIACGSRKGSLSASLAEASGCLTINGKDKFE